MLIHINGFPGVGKLTIARELEKLTGGRLIDNHAIINLAYLAAEHGTPEFFDLHKNLTISLYKTLSTAKDLNLLIFTNAQATELPEDVERFNSIKDLAASRNEVFIPVVLTCDQEEHRKRVVSSDRADRKKLTRVDILESMLHNYTAYIPDLPHTLVLDVTHLSPKEAAVIIKKHCDSFHPAPAVEPSPKI